jgi:outer membrane protein OmpA-like peptidoglycan-associated protein
MRAALLLPAAAFALIAAAQRPAVNDTAKVTIRKLPQPLNSPYNDYGPLVSADGSTLLFTSNRPVTEREKEKGRPAKENVYQVTFDERKRKWGTPVLLGPTVNAPGRNNSAVALSPDGQHMLLYRDAGEGDGNLFESTLIGAEWSEPVELPAPVRSAQQETSACYSPDGRTLFFVSDRPGGPGRKDIHRVSRDAHGAWGQVEVLGAPINTREDEEGVFLSADGRTLHFSSKGHGGAGGHDLFRSTRTGDGWGPPQNLGAPINTPDDDLYLVLLADERTGYFSSVRAGGFGLKDIYEVRIVPKDQRRSEEPRLTVLKGQVIDAETRLPVAARIDITDNAGQANVSTQQANASTGNFLLSLPAGKDYGIHVSAEGYLFHSEHVHMPDTLGYTEVVTVIGLKELKAGNTIVLNNVFYDVDRWTLRPESDAELVELAALMKANPGLRIELGSHTDNTGGEEHNQRLSEARARNVMERLIGLGIAADRLVAKGYGERFPVVPNDTEEGRRSNRRTEFKVLE